MSTDGKAGRVFRRCACRDERTGRQLGARCPQLAADPGHGTWAFDLRVPGPEGRTERLRRYRFATRAEAERACWQVRQGPGPQALAEMWTVRRFLEFWLSEVAGRLRPTTVSNYRWIVYTFLIPSLGGYRLSNLRPRNVQRFVNEMGRRICARTGRVVSPGTVHRVHAVLRTA